MTSQQALEGFFDAVEDGSTMGKSQALTESSMSTFGIENGRNNPDLTLDKASFEFIDCPTMMTTGDFFRAQHDESLKHQYFDEVISIVENQLGCEKVVCLNMQIHDNDGPKVDCERLAGMEDLYAFTKPHTSTSAKVTDEMAVSLAGEDHRYKRYAVLSLWRFIEDEKEEFIGQYKQLALMDERSCVKPDDYVAREKVAYRLDGKSTMDRYYSLNPRHANSHKWYYFPNMEMDHEAILIKQMDSDWSNPGRMCFQMGVPDPRHDIPLPEYASRKAAEVRMICFWETPASGVNSMPTVKDLMQQSGKNRSGDRSWLDKIMYGDGKVHEWLGKIESMSAGFMEGTEKMSLANLVSKATSCQGGGSAAMPLNLSGDGLGFKSEGYWGRYTKEYSDEMEDEYRRLYLPKFLEVVDSYPSWPPSSKSWARNEMRRFGHREVDRGIAEITCVIVDDSMGMVGTKHFPVSKKKTIIDFLIRNETYMYAAMAQWAPLAYDVAPPLAFQTGGPVKPMGQPPLEGDSESEEYSSAIDYADVMHSQVEPTTPTVVEGRDDQPRSRSKSPKRSQHKFGGRRKNKVSKYGRVMEDQTEESSDPSYEYSKSSSHHRRTRRLHDEYSQAKDEHHRRRVHHRRHPSDSSNASTPTESYDEDESELLRYSTERREQHETEMRNGGAIRQRHDSPETPEYYTDSSPGTMDRYDEEKSLAYSLESRNLYSSRGGFYDGVGGDGDSSSSYTHFRQRESSYRRRYEDRAPEEEEHVYTFNVNAPYTKATSNHPLLQMARQSSWEEHMNNDSEPSI